MPENMWRQVTTSWGRLVTYDDDDDDGDGKLQRVVKISCSSFALVVAFRLGVGCNLIRGRLKNSAN